MQFTVLGKITSSIKWGGNLLKEKSMQISKNHIIFIATGELDKNGNLYPADMTMDIPEYIPIMINYDEWNKIGHLQNASFKNGQLVGDIVNVDQTLTMNNKFPGACLIVDDKFDVGEPITHAKLYSIGILGNNIDPQILPIMAGDHVIVVKNDENK